jgi:hypothetical protein
VGPCSAGLARGKRKLVGCGGNGLQDLLRQSLQELGIHVQRLDPAKGEPQLPGFPLGLAVKVIEDLEVIGHKAGGDH